MRTTLYPIVCLVIGFGMTLSSCKIIKGITDQIGGVNKNIGDFKDELFPINELSRDLVIGLLDGATVPQSKENIDTLTDVLTRGITKYLNARIQTIKLDSLGIGFVNGAFASLDDEKNKAILQDVIDGLGADLNKNLKPILNHAIADLLESKEAKRALAGLMNQIINEKVLTEKLNGILDGLEFENVGNQLRNEVLDKRTALAFRQMIQPVDSVVAKLQATSLSIGDQNNYWWKHHFWKIIVSVVSVILLITACKLYILKQKHKYGVT